MFSNSRSFVTKGCSGSTSAVAPPDKAPSFDSQVYAPVKKSDESYESITCALAGSGVAFTFAWITGGVGCNGTVQLAKLSKARPATALG